VCRDGLDRKAAPRGCFARLSPKILKAGPASAAPSPQREGGDRPRSSDLARPSLVFGSPLQFRQIVASP